MRLLRPGLLLLSAGQLVTGGWAVAAPAHFYATFPGLRTGWVAADGPFNHHLVVDAGAGFAATGAALLLAALWPRRAAVVVALVAYLTQVLPHLAYHARYPAPGLPAVDQVLAWLPLAAGALLGTGLLALAVREPGARHRSLPSGGRTGPDGLRPSGGRTGPDGPVPPLGGRPRNLVLLAAFAAARRRLGTVPTSWRVLARVPRVAIARAHGDAAHEHTRIAPARLGALAELRAAVLVECAFCVDIGSATAVGHGVRDDQVRDIGHWRDSDAFAEEERLVLALADAMTATPARVPGDLVAALTDHLGAAGVVELVATIGHENARARTNRALGVAPQGFAAAASCPVPEPVSSPPAHAPGP